MRKVSPKVVLLVGLLVLIISVSGGVYAWFRSTESIVAGQAKAGTISLDGRQTCKIIVEDILPGEAVDMGTSSVLYTGNRNALIKISLSTVKDEKSSVDKSRILQPSLPTHKDWIALDPAIKATDYEFVGGYYRYTDKRLKEIVSLRDAGITPDLYQGSDGNFYIMMDPNTNVNLALVTYIVFEGEFGGLYNNGGGSLSPSRQFEQASQFYNLVINVEAIQITEAAIKDTWGNDTLNVVKSLPIFPQLQAESTWNL